MLSFQVEILIKCLYDQCKGDAELRIWKKPELLKPSFSCNIYRKLTSEKHLSINC